MIRSNFTFCYSQRIWYFSLGSLVEKNEIREAYLRSCGKITFIMQNVPFVTKNEEPRIRKIVEKLIRNEFLPTPSTLLQQRKVDLEIKRSNQTKKRKLVEVDLENDEQKRKRKGTARQIALSKK